ncbi:hypothetical protein COV82_00325 [Candidatus Peregrinibacteria bacterium CG11_big_fil_rev_8_21_14_0_20_46_8]|nr:MAG: hypothetical protein COV82_00325 [Candidatus Peregrinibacteria bacterium CG11_big_fil_rev_8_21_14_0_20_46_8]
MATPNFALQEDLLMLQSSLQKAKKESFDNIELVARLCNKIEKEQIAQAGQLRRMERRQEAILAQVELNAHAIGILQERMDRIEERMDRIEKVLLLICKKLEIPIN